MWLERGENTINPNQECPPRSTIYEEGIVMTMIGIDPHKATHTAVATDDNEVVLDEFKLRASTVQAQRLCEWVSRVKILGTGRSLGPDLKENHVKASVEVCGGEDPDCVGCV
ncbi:MAG: hypothetical protein GY788_27945, partial [bacterium]|nr:hypothetical protein [bacterium]